MGYDYYWSGSENAGPVSPLFGANLNIDNSILRYQNKGIDKHKIVLGLPWYGRSWEVEDSSYQSKVVGKSAAYSYDYIMDLGLSSHYDMTYSSNQIVFKDADAYNEIWFDDSLAFSSKIQYSIANNLLGSGVWALHYQSIQSKLWTAIENIYVNVSVNDETQEKYEPINIEYYDVLGNEIINVEMYSNTLLFQVEIDSQNRRRVKGIYKN
jgi:spore germination protein